MPIGIRYNVDYVHGRKEVVINFQLGSMPPSHFVMAAEAFIQDHDFITKDPKLAHFISEVRRRKDLPVDYDFGPGGGQIKFDPKEWYDKMGGKDDKRD